MRHDHSYNDDDGMADMDGMWMRMNMILLFMYSGLNTLRTILNRHYDYIYIYTLGGGGSPRGGMGGVGWGGVGWGVITFM